MSAAKVPTLDDVKTDELLHEVQGRGYTVTKRQLTTGQTSKIDLSRWGGKKYRFGVVSDTHLGSRYQQLTALNQFYSILARRRIKDVFHCGD